MELAINAYVEANSIQIEAKKEKSVQYNILNYFV